LVKQLGLQSPQAQRTTINSFPAIVIQADQAPQQGQNGQQAGGARTLTHLIQDGQTIYALVGLTSPADFATYGPQFQRSARGFARLTDASKLNRQPEKIRIKTVASATTLSQALAANGVPAARREELAILNGMKLTDQLSAGTAFKVIGK
jgi:predicted Zn-dependent protease